jgi:HK97 family phage major capsid protein/HK97 family phage prohead protease
LEDQAGVDLTRPAISRDNPVAMSKLPPTTRYNGVLREISAAEAKNLDERGIPKHLGPLQRKVQLSGYDKETNTVTMAVSSSTPVERYFGAEILSHEAGAINTERLKAGIPLLFNHDYDAHLGRSQSFKAGDPLHVTCRFGTNPLAIEKAGDVDTGILVDVSIGYIVDEWEIEENAKTGERKYTATKWTLLEVSLVTVPADPTVGVGRSSDPAPNVRSFRKVNDDGEEVDDEDGAADADDEGDRSQQAEPAPILETPTPEAQRTTTMEPVTAPVVPVGPDPAVVEANRQQALRALHTNHPKHFSAERLAAAIALGVDNRKASDAVFDAIVAEASQTDVPTIADEVLGRMSEGEQKRYSLRNVYAAAVNARTPGTFGDKESEAGLEKEVGESLRKLATERGITAFGGGIPIPSATSRALAQIRTIASGGGAGTATNFTTVEADPIELLRYITGVLSLGARMMPNLQGTIQMPRQTAAATSSWIPEASAVTNSDPTYDSISMSPKPLMIQNSYYRNFLAQSRMSIESELSNDRMKVLARSLDTAAIAGAGTGVIPLGVLLRSGLAAVLAGSTRSALGVFTAGAGGVPMTYVDFIAMESAIATANADISTLGWLLTPKVRGAARSTPKTPGTASDFVFPDSKKGANGIQEGPLSYNALATSNSVLTGFTANSVTGLHAVILGVWDQLMIGDWGLSEVIADPFTGASSQKIIITENAFYDIQVRHLESFCACVSALPS